VAAAATTTLSWQDRPETAVQAAVEAARTWNAAHGFTPATETSPAAPTADALAGDVAIIALRLAKPLAEGSQLTAIFAREGGDASFRTAEGDRFVITPANAGQPFFAVVQVDRQVEAATSAAFAVRSGNLPLAWSVTFYLLAGLFGVAALYHAAALPRPTADERHGPRGLLAGFAEPLAAFFAKPRIVTILAFLLLYRFAEAQLVKLAAPFLLDSREAGGLALSTGQVGFVYGTVGVVMLTAGGLLGGFAAARHGLKRWLWPMVFAINLPNAAYVYLALVRPESYWAVNAAVAIEQFGYGFGFTAYMIYCLYIAQGPHQTVHYALCTGCMALGMMLPGMWSGWLEEQLGYQRFFLWVMLATLPSFAVAALIPLDADFGRRRESTAGGEGDA
jgi:PAT family beta-lactamase induction signal transducer AmpG